MGQDLLDKRHETVEVLFILQREEGEDLAVAAQDARIGGEDAPQPEVPVSLHDHRRLPAEGLQRDALVGRERRRVNGEGAVELPLEEGGPILRLLVAEVVEPFHVETLAQADDGARLEIARPGGVEQRAQAPGGACRGGDRVSRPGPPLSGRLVDRGAANGRPNDQPERETEWVLEAYHVANRPAARDLHASPHPDMRCS